MRSVRRSRSRKNGVRSFDPAPRLVKAADIKKRPREIPPEVSILFQDADKDLERIGGLVKGMFLGKRGPRDEYEARLCMRACFGD